jgi:hypothetical protein
MKEEGGRMGMMKAEEWVIKHSFILHPSAFILIYNAYAYCHLEIPC